MDYPQEHSGISRRYASNYVDYLGWVLSTISVFPQSLFSRLITMIPGILAGPYSGGGIIKPNIEGLQGERAVKAKRYLSSYVARQLGRNSATTSLTLCVEEMSEKPSLEIGILTAASAGAAIGFQIARARSRKKLMQILEE